jgi:ABC-type cobalamin/Fe3+-siderophores transport system ATPase subunit
MFARGRREAIERAEQLLAFVGLYDKRFLRAGSLSFGQQKLLEFAMALMNEPDVLLLDEPTAHLDLEHTLSVLKLCRALAIRGTTVVLATHDVGNVARFAAAVVLLHGGRVVASGLPASVLTPARLRTVFFVDTQIVTTPDGHSALIFDVPSDAPGALVQGAHR